jgi:hypothetical protein
VDWINLAQDGDRWLDLVNTVMNLRVPYKAGMSSTAEQLLASKGELCSMKLTCGAKENDFWIPNLRSSNPVNFQVLLPFSRV